MDRVWSRLLGQLFLFTFSVLNQGPALYCIIRGVVAAALESLRANFILLR